MKNVLKQNKAITLIALVITIVVLIILAGVLINITLGENGILDKAKKSSFQMKRATILEAANLAYSEVYVEGEGEINPSTIADLTVAKMKTRGYDIKDITTESGTITEVNLDKNSLTINMGKTGVITISYQEGTASGARYFAPINGKYYELTIEKGNIQLGEEPVDIAELESETTVEETLVSQDENVATVDKTGNTITVTPVSKGTTTIVYTKGGHTKQCSVTVTNKVDSISINKETIEVHKNEETTIEAAISPAGAEGNLRWELADSSTIATLTVSGNQNTVLKITGVTPGTATINCINSEDEIIQQIPFTILEARKYTVNFYNDGNLYDTKEVEEGNSVTFPENPEKENYTFKGWSLTSVGTVVNQPFVPTSNTSLYAIYTNSGPSSLRQANENVISYGFPPDPAHTNLKGYDWKAFDGYYSYDSKGVLSAKGNSDQRHAATVKTGAAAAGGWVGWDFEGPVSIEEIHGVIRMNSFRIDYADTDPYNEESWTTASETAVKVGTSVIEEWDKKAINASTTEQGIPIYLNMNYTQNGSHRYWRLYVVSNEGVSAYSAYVKEMIFYLKQ